MGQAYYFNCRFQRSPSNHDRRWHLGCWINSRDLGSLHAKRIVDSRILAINCSKLGTIAILKFSKFPLQTLVIHRACTPCDFRVPIGMNILLLCWFLHHFCNCSAFLTSKARKWQKDWQPLCYYSHQRYWKFHRCTWIFSGHQSSNRVNFRGRSHNWFDLFW